MAHPPGTDTKQLARERRLARLAAEMRSNLLKRKAHTRGRALTGASSEYEGPDNGNDQPDTREAANADMKGPTGEAA